MASVLAMAFSAVSNARYSLLTNEVPPMTVLAGIGQFNLIGQVCRWQHHYKLIEIFLWYICLSTCGLRKALPTEWSVKKIDILIMTGPDPTEVGDDSDKKNMMIV
jgi:hypothetical protein